MITTLQNKISLQKCIFWDTPSENIDVIEHARFIIHRVITRGSIDDWRAIRDHYGLKKIEKEVLQMRHIDAKTLSLMSALFGIPKEKFRCYIKEPSMPGHWNY